MEELEADFKQMHMTEEIERHNKCSDQKEFLPTAIDDLSTEANLSLANDDVDELPVPKQVHHFYFVKVPPYKDLGLKLRIEEIERLIQKKSEAQSQITKRLEERKMDQASLHSELRWRHPNKNGFRDLIASRKKDMETLQQYLKKLRPNYSNKNPTTPPTLPSRNIVARSPWEVNVISEFHNLPYWNRKYQMENLRKSLEELLRGLRNPAERDNSPLEELHRFKKKLNNKMQHGSKSLANEKKLLKVEMKQIEAEEMKQIEAAREKVIANDTTPKPVFPYYLGSKKDIYKHIEILRDNMDQLKEEDRAFRTHRKLVERNLNASESDIRILERKRDDINRERNEAYQCLLQLLKQNEAEEDCHQQHLSLMNNVKELAKKKDVETLKELSNRQVEEFMCQWNSNKAFRDGYVNKIKPSKDINGGWRSEGLERIQLGKSPMMQLRPGGKTLGNNKCKPNQLCYWWGLFNSHKF